MLNEQPVSTTARYIFDRFTARFPFATITVEWDNEEVWTVDVGLGALVYTMAIGSDDDDFRFIRTHIDPSLTLFPEDLDVACPPTVCFDFDGDDEPPMTTADAPAPVAPTTLVVTFVDESGDTTAVVLADATLDDEDAIRLATVELNRQYHGEDYDDHFDAGDLEYDFATIEDEVNVMVHRVTPVSA